jgi:hypothetical protein
MQTLTPIDQKRQETGNLTNELGLPAPIVNAIRGDDYSRGDCDFTVTELIKPVRIRSLSKKWRDHLIEDVSDKIFSLFGRAMHKVLEQAADPRYCMVEKRYYADFEFEDHELGKNWNEATGSLRVGGQFDILDYVFDKETNVLSDYKLTSRYSTGDGVKPEWEQQMNCNAFLLRKNGIPVDGLQIVAIFRDWSKMRAAQKNDYPQKQIQILPVEMWQDVKTEEFIRERIKAHVEGEENPPVCSPEERWRKPDKWALMKKGNKRAVKLYDEENHAHGMAAQDNQFHPGKFYVEPRPGEDVRCEFYCPVSAYCSYWQEQLQEKIA